MRLEHHLVGGYVRYISPYIIIIIIKTIFFSNNTTELLRDFSISCVVTCLRKFHQFVNYSCIVNQWLQGKYLPRGISN